MDLTVASLWLVFLLALAGSTLAQSSALAILRAPLPLPRPTAGCGSDLQEKIINSILGQQYNKHVPPPPGDSPLPVQVNIAVLNIVSVDEEAHLWKTNVYVRQEWDDTRLQYASLVSGCPKFRYIQLLTDDVIETFWKPNLFFPDEVDGKILDLLQTNRVIRIFPNGHIFYSVHASVTLSCSGLGSRPGEFLCPMQLYPYGPEIDSIVLSWHPNPVQLSRPGIMLPDHVVGDIDTSVTHTVSVTGTYSTLIANFHFPRKACLA